MNILWLSHLIPYPPKGGVLQRSYHLLRETTKRHDVYLLAFRQRALHPTQESVGEAVAHLRGLCKLVEVVDIPWERWRLGWHALVLYSLFSLKPYAVNWMRSREMARRLRSLLAHERIDLIHCDTIGLAEYALLGGGIPKVLNHHNAESWTMLRRCSREKDWLKKLYFYAEGIKLGRYEKRLCPQFDKNVTVSRLDALRLQEKLPGVEAIEVPNCVDIDYFRPSNATPIRGQLIFIGRLSAYPNIQALDFFCEHVWPVLKTKQPDLNFLIIGRNPDPQCIKRWEKGVDIKVLGYVDDVRPYLANAHIYICPIQDGGGTKLKILDAMAAGKAIIAHPIACEGINISPGEDVLLAETADDFLHQISKILKNDSLRISMERNARGKAETLYSVDYAGQILTNLYAGLGSPPQVEKDCQAAKFMISGVSRDRPSVRSRA